MKEIQEIIAKLKSSSFQEDIYSGYIEYVIDAITYLEEYNKKLESEKIKKNEIIVIEHIHSSDASKFSEIVMDTVKRMQTDGLEVEIKYQYCDVYHSALLIGKKEV